MKTSLSWPMLLKPGLGWAHLAALPRREVEEFASTLKPKKHAAVRIIRGRDCTTKADLLKEFARALDFPSYFGGNWDALEDCLTDLEWLSSESFVLVLTNADLILRNDPESWRTLASVLQSAAAHWANSNPATSFHCLFHCEPGTAEDLRARLGAAGVSVA
ncbi:MAG TPA: barstar family protein [Bacteroidota bacterium]|nr:barstar family protein [Bacteroidota bacterium]